MKKLKGFHTWVMERWDWNLAVSTIVITAGGTLSLAGFVLQHNLPVGFSANHPWEYYSCLFLYFIVVALVVFYIAVKLVIYATRWRFHREFTCDLPRAKDHYASTSLQPMIDARMTRLATGCKVTEIYLEKIKTEFDPPTWPSGERLAHNELMAKVMKFVTGEQNKTWKAFKKAKQLATTSFIVHGVDDYIRRLRDQHEHLVGTLPGAIGTHEG